MNHTLIVRKSITIAGAWQWTPAEYAEAFTMISSGRVDRKPFITHVFPLSRAKEAYETQLKAADAIKVMIEP